MCTHTRARVTACGEGWRSAKWRRFRGRSLAESPLRSQHNNNMPYVADLAAVARLEGSVVGEPGFTPGQCVAFVKKASGAPATAGWRKGAHVKSSPPSPGTAIASFSGAGGTYSGGHGHAAIFVRLVAGGIEVWDQWVGHPVSKRVLHFKGGGGDYSNDGDLFYVIE